jgi:hypothetical protein
MTGSWQAHTLVTTTNTWKTLSWNGMKTQYLYMSKHCHASLSRTSNCEYGHSSLLGRLSPMSTWCGLMMIMAGSQNLRFGQCRMLFHIPTMWKVEGLNCGPEKVTHGSFGVHSIGLDVHFWPSLDCKMFPRSQMSVLSSRTAPEPFTLILWSLLDYSTNLSGTLSPLRAWAGWPQAPCTRLTSPRKRSHLASQRAIRVIRSLQALCLGSKRTTV